MPLSLIRSMCSRFTGTLRMLCALVLTGGFLIISAVPASADTATTTGYINLSSTQAIPGTNCLAEVGVWNNAQAYPGVGMYVICGSRHLIQVKGFLYKTNPDGTSPALYMQTGWFNYNNAYNTQIFGVYHPACPPGRRAWQARMTVWIDGIYGYTFVNKWYYWTPC